jgi:hypothetical protein
VCVLGGGRVAAIVLDLVLPGAALLAAVAGLQELAGADLGERWVGGYLWLQRLSTLTI